MMGGYRRNRKLQRSSDVLLKLRVLQAISAAGKAFFDAAFVDLKFRWSSTSARTISSLRPQRVGWYPEMFRRLSEPSASGDGNHEGVISRKDF